MLASILGQEILKHGHFELSLLRIGQPNLNSSQEQLPTPECELPA
jgi:hypothetical protein